MRAYDRLAVACGAATLLAASTLMVTTQDRSYLGWSLLLVGLMTAAGAVVHRTRAGDGGALLAQVVVLAGFLLTLGWWALGPGTSGLADPSIEPLDWIGRLASAGVGHLQSQSAPMVFHTGVVWLMVATVGVALLLTNLLVCTLHHPAWGIAPGLTLYAIPALTLRSDLGVAGGLAVALGYLGILLAESLNRAERWRRGVIEDAANPPRAVAPVLWGSAALVAVPALVLSLLAWLVVPSGSIGLPTGAGTGANGPIQLGDPTIDLKRNLVRPDDVPVLNYTTTGGDGRGTYLRLASLPRFDAAGWQNAQIQLVQGQPGAIPGASGQPGAARTTTIRIGDFDSEYLPLPYAPRSITIDGDWGYDPMSLVYVAMTGERGRATRNRSYQVESTDIVPDPGALSRATAGSPADSDLTLPVPSDLPPEIRDLTARITAGASTPALKAARIQAFLRDGDFTYSTAPKPGSGYQTLTDFLFRDRTGYCEQFAAAMAVMARVAGIPSRVAIGFLPGDRVGNGYVVSTHDLHAWPELYFDGIGWVRWEPTPGNGTVAPSWTRVNETGPTSSATASATDTVDPTLDPGQTGGPDDQPTEAATSEAPGAGGDQGPWGVIALLCLLGGAVLVLAAAAPAVFRIRQRERRLGTGTTSVAARVDGAWQEVRSTVVDFRGEWPAGSPRAIARQLSRGLEPSQARDVADLALLVERTRYARGAVAEPDIGGLRATAERIRDAVIGPASRWQRIRAALWPRSLWADWRSSRAGRIGGSERGGSSETGSGLSGRRGL